MKREFLQNILVEGNPLPKAVIDSIMEENGKDIQSVKGRYGDYDALREELEQTNTALKDYETLDVQALRQNARDWEEKYYAALQEHRAQMGKLKFETLLQQTITSAGGRNAKAITALLDTAALAQAEDPETAVQQAVAQVKQQCDYLFHDPAVSPPYARGTGAQTAAPSTVPGTLAGALREKFERN